MQQSPVWLILWVLLSIPGFSQQHTAYSFALDDTALRKQLFTEALAGKEAMIASLPTIILP